MRIIMLFVENYDDYSGHFGSQLLDDESCEKYTDGEGDRGQTTN